MAFTLPVFNLSVNIWRFGNPTSNPPDVRTVGNLAYGERTSVPYAVTTSNTTVYGGMWLLTPPGTDIRDDKAPAGADTVEVPAGTGRFYEVVWVDDAGSGFPNEHRFALIISTAPWPVPFPSPTPPGPTPPVPVSSGAIGPGDPLTLVLPSNPTSQTFVLVFATLTGGGGSVPSVVSASAGALTPSVSTGGVSVGSDTTTTSVYILPAWPGGDILTITEGQTQFCLFNLYLFPSLPNTVDSSGFHSGGLGSLPMTVNGGTPTTNPLEWTVCWVMMGDTTTNPTFTSPFINSTTMNVFQLGTTVIWCFASAVSFTTIATIPTCTVNGIVGLSGAQDVGIMAIL